MTRSRTAVLGLLLLVMFGACQAPTSAQSPSPAVAESVAPAGPTREELEAIRFRTDFGLEADIAFVRAVAADPTADSETFGVPLLPAEVEELMARGANAKAVLDAVLAEAEAHPEDYCGRYIDNENGGAFTSMWRANLAMHSAAILLKVGPSARVAFRDCTFSEEELDRVMELLNEADRSWMDDIPAVASSWGVNASGNRIEMEISSAFPGAADVVRKRYETALGLPPGMLIVHSDGTGAGLRPWGTVLVSVVQPNGKPVGPNNLGLNWQSIDVPFMSCGVGDVGFGVSPDGQPTELPCQAGVWRIWAFDSPGPDQDWKVYGEGRVTVEADRTANLTIKLTEVPPKPIE